MLFLGGFLGVVIAWSQARTARLSRLLGVAILAIIGLDLAEAGMRLHPTVTTRAYGPMEFNMSSLPRFGESRALVTQQSESILDRLGMADPVAYCVSIRGALYENNNLLEGVPKADGFCSLHIKEQAEAFAALGGGTNLLAEPLANFSAWHK